MRSTQAELGEAYTTLERDLPQARKGNCVTEGTQMAASDLCPTLFES